LPVKAFAAAAAFTSAGAWPGSGPANSCRVPAAPAARAMMIRRWTWPAPAGSFGGRSPGLPSAYIRN